MVSQEGGDNMLPLLCINSRTVHQHDHIYSPVHDDVPSITMLISVSGQKLNANILFDCFLALPPVLVAIVVAGCYQA